MKEVLKDITESLKNMGKDKEITDKTLLSLYLDIITQNIKDNLRVMNRNSYLLVLSAVLFYLIKNDFISLAENNFLGFKINSKDDTLILNLILVLFSFLYFKNISIWYQVSNLKRCFDDVSTKLFDLGLNSGSLHLLRPFFLLQNTDYYLVNNNKVKGVKKIPIILSYFAVMIAPIIFEIYALVYLIINSYPNFLSISSISITIIFLILTIQQSYYTSK